MLTRRFELAAKLAVELDKYLFGAHSYGQLQEIELALFEGEDLRATLEWFDDLEEAAAVVAPGAGQEFLDFEGFARIATKAREELRRIYAV
jgi:hypothetical protein